MRAYILVPVPVNRCSLNQNSITWFPFEGFIHIAPRKTLHPNCQGNSSMFYSVTNAALVFTRCILHTATPRPLAELSPNHSTTRQSLALGCKAPVSTAYNDHNQIP